MVWGTHLTEKINANLLANKERQREGKNRWQYQKNLCEKLPHKMSAK